jgi:hypothetical protein
MPGRPAAAPKAGRDAVGAGVPLAPLLAPQPATRAPASSTGPSVRGQAARPIPLRKSLLNDVSLGHGTAPHAVPGLAGSGRASVPTGS